jgi:hypothetical protein
LGPNCFCKPSPQSLAPSSACRFVVGLDDRRPVTGASQGPPR